MTLSVPDEGYSSFTLNMISTFWGIIPTRGKIFLI
jgi:hypothetical protein